MKIGVICDDYWHPGKLVTEGLELLSEQGYTFHYIQHASEWSREWMNEHDAVVLAKSNQVSAVDETPWLTPDIQQQFQSYVEEGKGLLVLHAGAVGYRAEPLFYELVGGVFEHHPEACPVTISSLNEELGIAIAQGTYTIHDEHYFMEVIDERIQVFMQSESVHGTQPAGWVREQGKGRVCVLTPGHFLHVLQHTDYQATIKNAINWVSAARS
ncbi:type 1 glutamine amidotransferase [Paenibacillus endophyticus]|uniref:Type 1 glutamine amidotransferase n=1 Tax=Paenibacillus endophyticus TaxID=1294268 RepID=A0A7W5C969_9BACL|nr:ThuA domain-containing protein [Paenibacillus endophyticus]MBB3153453.1 type 1 glutamine amidotransferase [Paenibacillus endophyticus]